jgi:Putative polyhydroxyalkanoic acid system protein (PHA_gran_rgn)
MKIQLTHTNQLGRSAGREAVDKKISQALERYKLVIDKRPDISWQESMLMSFSNSAMMGSAAGQLQLFDTRVSVDVDIEGPISAFGEKKTKEFIKKLLDECGF